MLFSMNGITGLLLKTHEILQPSRVIKSIEFKATWKGGVRDTSVHCSKLVKAPGQRKGLA